jgi:microsomal dipeptidase-like Zn-dependent dipeptidase
MDGAAKLLWLAKDGVAAFHTLLAALELLEWLGLRRACRAIEASSLILTIDINSAADLIWLAIDGVAAFDALLSFLEMLERLGLRRACLPPRRMCHQSTLALLGR